VGLLGICMRRAGRSAIAKSVGLEYGGGLVFISFARSNTLIYDLKELRSAKVRTLVPLQEETKVVGEGKKKSGAAQRFLTDKKLWTP